MTIPEGWVAWAKGVAGVQPEDDGLGEYPLNEEQTRTFGQQFGFKPEPGRFYYYFEPYDPPEDTRFQPRPTPPASADPAPAARNAHAWHLGNLKPANYTRGNLVQSLPGQVPGEKVDS